MPINVKPIAQWNPMSTPCTTDWHLWQRLGVELEYMIVDRESLAVRPLADYLLQGPSGEQLSDLERGAVGWSNELVRHVIEFKCAHPVTSLDGWADLFHGEVQAANEMLRRKGAMLLPSAAHPFMDPRTDTYLWTHDNREIYATYDRIFNCQGHGWSNLQSTHLNLSFCGDEEFGRLHAAIRAFLPLIPSLAASSPFLDSRFTGYKDARLETYRHNQERVPVITGQVIPEAVFSRAEYDREIFDRVKAAIAPHDTEHVLDHFFLNSRGAIARFDRGAIEIRLVDIQECPAADIAIAETEIAVLHALAEGEWGDPKAQRALGTGRLYEMLMRGVKDAEGAVYDWPEFLAVFGYPGTRCSAQELWQHLAERVTPMLSPDSASLLSRMLKRGSLSSALLAALGPEPAREDMARTYHQLARCLARNELYHGG